MDSYEFDGLCYLGGLGQRLRNRAYARVRTTTYHDMATVDDRITDV